MVTAAQIDLWRQAASETQRLEFKEAKTGYGREKLASYCVAIANEGGGHLILGVADAPPRLVVGSSAISDPIDMADKLFQQVGFRVEIDVVDHPEGRVVVLGIPSRPRGTAYHLDGKYLMRSGSSLVPMSEDRLRAIFNEGKPDWLEQPSIRGLSAQDVVELLDTQSYFELFRRPYPTTREGVLSRLIIDHLVDETDGLYSIRRIGAILFAKRIAKFPDVARKAPRVVVYNGTSKLETKLDQLGAYGYASGFRLLVQYIMAQLPQNEVIENALRKSVKLLSDTSIRELVANALVHQDFDVTGAGPMIEIFSDRVEVSNPGTPIVPVDRFIDGYQSRNERLADLMRRMNICEEKSSGIDRVVTEVELNQLPAPDFRLGHNRTVTVVFGPRGFEEMDRDDRVRACYQHCVLRWVMSQPMTNQSLRERFGLGEAKAAIASQIITATTDVGLIKPDESVGGSRKFARYLPIWA